VTKAQPSDLIATIDFEATALRVQGEPIEVGLALWRRGDPILEWSSLIAPSPAMIWNVESAEVHGITVEELQSAPHPREVAAKLNELMQRTEIAYCDGGALDDRWCQQLYEAAGLQPVFRLSSYVRMPGLRVETVWNRMRFFLQSTKPPHRAGKDAVRLMHAYAYAIGEASVEVIRL